MTMLKRMLFKYMGYVSAALVLGGVDASGPHLYTIYPHGSTDKLPFVTMGSGSLAAMAIFEAEYKDDMTVREKLSLLKIYLLTKLYRKKKQRQLYTRQSVLVSTMILAQVQTLIFV